MAKEKDKGGLPELFGGKGKSINKLWLIAGALALGVLLIVLGSRGGGRAETAESNETLMTLEEYEVEIRRKIADLCSGVAGVGDVRVAVSFESDFEYVYARNTDAKSDGSSESKYLTVGSGSSESTVFLTRRPPKIGGVGIVCAGGGNTAIQNELIMLVSRTFGVNSNRIYVSEAKK